MHPALPDGTPGRILAHLKRAGRGTIPELARAFGLSAETIRAHVRALGDDGLVEGVGARRRGPGRPEGIYALTRRAEQLFPRREAELLQGLATYLRARGEEELLTDFLAHFAEERRILAERRLEGLDGDARLREVARILTDEGYMAEVRHDPGAPTPRLRLCHCPVRELVDVTRAPCRAEMDFVRALVGGGALARVEYIPDGDAACAYALPERGGA